MLRVETVERGVAVLMTGAILLFRKARERAPDRYGSRERRERGGKKQHMDREEPRKGQAGNNVAAPQKTGHQGIANERHDLGMFVPTTVAQ